MKLLQKFSVVFALIVCVAQVAWACNGYNLRMLRIENCAGPYAVVTLDPNLSVSLNRNCEAVVSGCVINRAYNTGFYHARASKYGFVFKEEKLDICVPDQQKLAQMTSGDIGALRLFGLPIGCPVPAEHYCGNYHKVDISQYRSLLSLAEGNVFVDVEIDHDNGRSCFHMELEIWRG